MISYTQMVWLWSMAKVSMRRSAASWTRQAASPSALVRMNDFVRIVNLFGTTFHHQSTEQTCRTFFEKLGYTDGTYDIVDGRMACDIAVFTKQ